MKDAGNANAKIIPTNAMPPQTSPVIAIPFPSKAFTSVIIPRTIAAIASNTLKPPQKPPQKLPQQVNGQQSKERIPQTSDAMATPI